MSVKDNTYGIADLQDKMLDILKFFISVCEQNDLHYWLAGGSCLGALRHGGFIPWDDDLDVYMPRKDYEKLWSLMKDKTIDGHYVLCRTTESKNYHHRVMQIVDIDTTFIHSRSKNEDIEHGVYIDVIPIDACPNSKCRRFAQFVNAVLFSICNIQQKPEYNGGKLTGVMSLGTKMLLGIIRSQKSRYKVWSKAERRMTKYDWEKCSHIKCITSQFHELMTAFPKAWFGERKAQFEDIVVSVPSDAEAYCKAMYGDYMSLPPEEKRAVRHHTEYIDLNEPYQMYKGIYYCKE